MQRSIVIVLSLALDGRVATVDSLALVGTLVILGSFAIKLRLLIVMGPVVEESLALDIRRSHVVSLDITGPCSVL